MSEERRNEFPQQTGGKIIYVASPYGHALSDHQRASVEKLDGLYQPGPFSAPRGQPEQEQTSGSPKMHLG